MLTANAVLSFCPWHPAHRDYRLLRICSRKKPVWPVRGPGAHTLSFQRLLLSERAGAFKSPCTIRCTPWAIRGTPRAIQGTPRHSHWDQTRTPATPASGSHIHLHVRRPGSSDTGRLLARARERWPTHAWDRRPSHAAPKRSSPPLGVFRAPVRSLTRPSRAERRNCAPRGSTLPSMQPWPEDDRRTRVHKRDSPEEPHVPSAVRHQRPQYRKRTRHRPPPLALRSPAGARSAQPPAPPSRHPGDLPHVAPCSSLFMPCFLHPRGRERYEESPLDCLKHLVKENNC